MVWIFFFFKNIFSVHVKSGEEKKKKVGKRDIRLL